MKLAQMLSEEKERRGWSSRAAARELGVAPGTYEGWEKGWRTPDIDNFKRIADFLGVATFVVLGAVGLLTEEEVESVRATPGLLVYAEGLALSMVQKQGYLKPARAKVLVAS